MPLTRFCFRKQRRAIAAAGLLAMLGAAEAQNLPPVGVLYSCNNGATKLKVTRCTSGTNAACEVQFCGNQTPPEPTGSTRMSREQLAGTLRTCVLPNGQPALATARPPATAQAANAPFKVGDIAMAYSMFGWIQVRILEVKGDQYRLQYMDRSNMWVKASNLRRPTAAATRSGAGSVPPGGATKSDAGKAAEQKQNPPSPPQQPPATAPRAPEQAYGKVEPAPANPVSDKSGTPAATASLAAGAGKYDIVGIRLGMPIRDALAALKAHSSNFKLQPESIRYEFLPNALTYGISALPLSMAYTDGRLMPPNTEKFYFMLTMPPNHEVVSKLARVMVFGKDTVPTGDVVAGDLIKKYGPPSWDSGPASLNELGARDMFWADDQQGNRLRLSRDALYQCATLQTFKMSKGDTDRSLTGSTDLAIPPSTAKIRLEQGYFNQAEFRSEECAGYTMIRARLFDTRSLGISTPNLVAGLMVMIASGPLDRSATDATHQFLIQAVKARDAKQTDAAKQNRPKL